MGPKERGWTASLCRNWSHLGWFWAPKNACHHFCSRCTKARASRGKSCEFCGNSHESDMEELAAPRKFGETRVKKPHVREIPLK